MTDAPHHDDPLPTSADPSAPETSEKKIGTLGWVGVAMVVIVLIAGVAVSAVILSRHQDTPLVPLGDAAPSTVPTPDLDGGLFQPDPEFDSLNRVVYVPKDQNGAVLEQQSPPAGRSADTAPSGVLLERVHGNMVLPFSTSDGPTAIDSSGVATGFSHTPQGAALAAAHYLAYIVSGNDRVSMLAASNRADDPTDTLAATERYNATGILGSVANGAPALALPLVRLNYTDTLTRVWFGYSATLKKDGSTQYRRSNVDLIWRTDRGWVVQIRPLDSPQGPTVGGSMDNTPFEPGWLTWW